MDNLENEWETVNLELWTQSCLRDCVTFWAEVSEKKKSAGEQRYPNISSLALALAYASVERIFFQMNVVHSKLRNRL